MVNSKPKPKPTKVQKAKKNRQRVLVLYENGEWKMGFRSSIPSGAKRVYALGTKYITEHAALVDILDYLCSLIVRQRDGYQCVLCGSRNKPQNGHVIVRGKWPVRWDLLNQHCQCDSCNLRHGRKQEAWYYYNWFKQKFGDAAWEDLCKRADDGGKSWTVVEMRELVLQYEELREKMSKVSVFDDDTIQKLGLYGEWRRNAVIYHNSN